MKWLWNNQTIESLGLDINTTSITLLYLTRTNTKCQIQQAVYIPIEQYKFGSFENAAINAIKLGVAQLKTPYRKVNIAISDVSTLSRTFTLDTNNASWQKVALLTMAPEIPMPLDKVYCDFETKKVFTKSHSATVLGIACPQSILDAKLEIIKSAGLQPKIVELESHAIERALRYLEMIQKHSKLSACIYVTVNTVTILLWLQQTVIAMSSDYLTQNSNSAAVTQQLQQTLSHLLFTSTIQPLQICYMTGQHPLRLNIAATWRAILGFDLCLFKLKFKQNSATASLAAHSIVAFGLALRE